MQPERTATTGPPLPRPARRATVTRTNDDTATLAARHSLAQWAVLGLIVERPRHGFAVSSLLAPGTTLGRVWKVPRPLVYRAIAQLEEAALVERAGVEHAGAGPQRTVLRATPLGLASLRTWLAEPVDHLRDLRSALLLKLYFHDRLGLDERPLLEGQQQMLAALVRALEREWPQAEGFDATLLEWRLASARAAAGFVGDRLARRRAERG